MKHFSKIWIVPPFCIRYKNVQYNTTWKGEKSNNLSLNILNSSLNLVKLKIILKSNLLIYKSNLIIVLKNEVFLT